MNIEVSTDLILNLIEAEMVSIESRKIFNENLALIKKAKFEGGVVNEIEVDRVIEIYRRREELARSQGKFSLGFDELMRSLVAFSGTVRPILAVTEKYKIIMFLSGKMDYLIGSIFIEI